jgi:osmoprotectant transport system ATP-binding protein
MLRARNVSRQYGRTCALAPLDLDLKKGKILVLLGQSGSGKSTLLRLCMGLIKPTTGSVEFENEVVTADNIKRLRLKMGYVIQDGGLFPHLTARDNILLVARYLKKEAAADTYLKQLIELTQLPLSCLRRYPAQLSGGQRQRVSLLRALVMNPDLLLLDEPLGALDPLIRSDLQVDLLKICRSLNKTVILVTHDLAEAEFFGDEIWLMRDGQVLQRGTFNDLATNPADDFVNRFVQAQRGVSIPAATFDHN